MKDITRIILGAVCCVLWFLVVYSGFSYITLGTTDASVVIVPRVREIGHDLFDTAIQGDGTLKRYEIAFILTQKAYDTLKGMFQLPKEHVGHIIPGSLFINGVKADESNLNLDLSGGSATVRYIIESGDTVDTTNLQPVFTKETEQMKQNVNPPKPTLGSVTARITPSTITSDVPTKITLTVDSPEEFQSIGVSDKHLTLTPITKGTYEFSLDPTGLSNRSYPVMLFSKTGTYMPMNVTLVIDRAATTSPQVSAVTPQKTQYVANDRVVLQGIHFTGVIKILRAQDRSVISDTPAVLNDRSLWFSFAQPMELKSLNDLILCTSQQC